MAAVQSSEVSNPPGPEEGKEVFPNLKKILWDTVDGKDRFLEDCVNQKHIINAEIIPTVCVLTNTVKSIIIASPDRARSFIEMESTWDHHKHRDDMKKRKCNRNLPEQVGKFMLGYLKEERKTVRCMFLNNQDVEDIKTLNCFEHYSTMYIIDFCIIRQVPIDYMKPLLPSERMSPFGVRCILHDDYWNPINLNEIDASVFRHFCTSNRHKIEIMDISYDDHGIPTANIHVIPSDTLSMY